MLTRRIADNGTIGKNQQRLSQLLFVQILNVLDDHINVPGSGMAQRNVLVVFQLDRMVLWLRIDLQPDFVQKHSVRQGRISGQFFGIGQA